MSRSATIRSNGGMMTSRRCGFSEIVRLALVTLIASFCYKELSIAAYFFILVTHQRRIY